jgi:hypothetical protein
MACSHGRVIDAAMVAFKTRGVSTQSSRGAGQMLRRVSAVAIALTLFGGTVVSASPASAAKPKPTIQATGDVTCGGAVTMKAGAYAMAGFGTVTAKFKARLRCQGSTGNSLVKVKRAIVSGTYQHQGDCSILGVHSHASPANTYVALMNITWKAVGGKMNTTYVGYSNHDARADGWKLPAPSPAGTSTVSGSYAGTGTSGAHIGIAAPPTLQSMCSSPKAKAKFTGIFLITL